MGILSSRYKFTLGGQAWCVSVRFRLRSEQYQYVIDIDGTVLVDVQPEQSTADMIKQKTFEFLHAGTLYRVEIAPYNWFDFGVHVYVNEALIYRHKDRDFVDMPKLTRFLAWADTVEAKAQKESGEAPRQMWKHLLQGAILGVIIGIACALIGAILEANGLSVARSYDTLFVMALAMLVAVFWPKKWNFIR